MCNEKLIAQLMQLKKINRLTVLFILFCSQGTSCFPLRWWGLWHG